MMKLGILICDQVRAELQTEFGEYSSMFSRLIALTEIPVSLRYYWVVDGELPADIHECDAYLTSGSKFSVNDDEDWINQLEQFVLTLDKQQKPLAGVCFGHQLIAKVMGGRVETSNKGWGVGIASAVLKKEQQQPWMQPFKPNIHLLVSHQEQVASLPAHSQVLLTNAFCPVSMYQIGQHFIGVQGHPEFTPDYSAALMNARREAIGEETVSAGLSSLSQKSDGVLVMTWLLNFLQQGISN